MSMGQVPPVPTGWDGSRSRQNGEKEKEKELKESVWTPDEIVIQGSIVLRKSSLARVHAQT